jgi:arylsulfatase B
MSEFYKEAGYSTHLVGKWHLGFYQEQYTPTKRGFDTHFGYLGPYIDYWDYTFQMYDRNYSRGLDFRNNLEADGSHNGTYATDLLTDKAIEVIENHDQKSPLFLMVTHLAPHSGKIIFSTLLKLIFSNSSNRKR